MSASINYQFLAAVSGGPSVSASENILTDSYELVQVTVEAAATGMKVELDINDKVDMVVIRADKYEALSYKKTAGGALVAITGPLILIGGGAVGLLGTTVASLFFSNSGANAREITILISRDATP